MKRMKLKFKYLRPEMWSNGERCRETRDLTPREKAKIKKEIAAIGADESIFRFSNKMLYPEGTHYDAADDVIYVTMDVFRPEPDASTHPRDLMQPRSVLAVEYYGQRFFRDKYLRYLQCGLSVPSWQDTCRACLVAAILTPDPIGIGRSYMTWLAYRVANDHGRGIRYNAVLGSLRHDWREEELDQETALRYFLADQGEMP